MEINAKQRLIADRTVDAKIYVTQKENDKYFNQKLPTLRHGFCCIKRKVTLTPDPDEIYDDGNYGYITVGGKKITVIGSGDSFEIQ